MNKVQAQNIFFVLKRSEAKPKNNQQTDLKYYSDENTIVFWDKSCFSDLICWYFEAENLTSSCR